jgi:GNAT superfamily N-acetyltransferase
MTPSLGRAGTTSARGSLRGVDAALEISTDRERIDRGLVHRFLSEQSYWARSRTREENDRIIDASLVFGVFEDGRQLAYARVVTDTASFGYLGDVFVLSQARGRGIGKALMRAVLEHPDVRDVRRLALLTDDAHGLYEQFGFAPLDDVRKWMQRRP